MWKVHKGSRQTDNPNILEGTVSYEDENGEVIYTTSKRVDVSNQEMLSSVKADLLAELAVVQAEKAYKETLRTDIETFLNS